MANNPKSALATLLDSIGNSKPGSVLPVDADVVIPNMDQLSENILEAKVQLPLTSHGEDKLNLNDALPRLINVNPNECHLWKFSDRPQNELGDIEALAISMKQNGQQEPILIRANTQTTKHRYEIIFGNRRWQAAKSLNLSLVAIIKDITDQEAARFQKEENENRQDLSDYSRASSYAKQIDSKIFKSESDLGKSLNISKQTLNDIMAYIRVPQKIIDSIPNYKDISRLTAVKLASLSKNKDLQERLIELGSKIGSKIITAANLEQTLNKKHIKKLEDKFSKVVNASGKTVAKLKQGSSGAVTINIGSAFTHKSDIDILCKALSKLLSGTT